MCRTTKQVPKISSTRQLAEFDSQKDNEAKALLRVEEMARRMAALQVVAAPEIMRPHEVSPSPHILDSTFHVLACTSLVNPHQLNLWARAVA